MSSNLRPSRQLRGDGAVDVAAEGAPTETPANPRKSAFVPYLGTDSIPKLAQDQKFSAPALEVQRFGKSFKVLRYRRSAIGVVRDTLRILQPTNKKRPQDKLLMAQLKKAGIPGAV